MRLIILTALLVGAVLAVGAYAAVVMSANRSQDQQVQRFAQWEQCELNSNGSGGAGDPCGPMPVP